MPFVFAAVGLLSLLSVGWLGMLPDGILSGRGALLGASGLGLLIAATLSRANSTLAGLLALLVSIQAAGFALTDAGPTVRYPHLFPPARWLEPNALFALAVVIVSGVAIGTRFREIAGIWNAARDALGLRSWVLLALTALFFVTGAVLSKSPVESFAELALGFLLRALGLLVASLLAASIPKSWASRTSAALDRRLLLFATTWVLLITSALAYFVYQRHPHVPDEVAYLLQARYLAEGKLWLPSPPVPEAFDTDLMSLVGDRWFSPTPPGWPMLLAIGVLFKVSWLVNPIVSAATVPLAYSVTRSVAGIREAKWVVLLFATSPWFLFIGMSYMGHASALCLTLAATWLVDRVRQGRSWGLMIPAGLAIGIVSWTRPLEGVTLAVALGLWTLSFEGKRRRALLPLAVATALVGSAQLLYNQLLTGNALLFPITEYCNRLYGPGSNDLGFGPNRGLNFGGLDPFAGHGLRDVVLNGHINVALINLELLGWVTGSLLGILVLFGSGRARRSDYGVLAAGLSIVFVHSFYWFSGGPDFGARYWYLVIFPGLLLTARGIEVVAEAAAGSAERIRAAAVVLCLLAVGLGVPFRAADKYFHYRRMRPDVRELIAGGTLGRSLVLIEGRRHPDYASAVIYNPTDLSANEPILAWDRGEELTRRLRAAFPDRTILRLRGPTITNGRYEIVREEQTGSRYP
ncbi:MAG: hypothetical protein HY795_18505 [Desulfovibrio sp.]|nr:hypothetical protein [Desulfovibrio sp.]